MKKALALFDFDGTITSKDTLFDIARFSTNGLNYWMRMGLMIPIFALMKISLIAKSKGKELFLKMFFAGMPLQKFNALCKKYSIERLPEIIRPLALEEIMKHQKNGADIYIVSASPENWIEPWANELRITVLSTKLEVKNGLISGNIDGENCNGEEKVNRIKSHIDLNQYDKILGYGDTKGDLPMLKLATTSNYKPFI